MGDIDSKGNPSAIRGTFLHEKEYEDNGWEGLKKFEQRALEKNKALSDNFISLVLGNLGIHDLGEKQVFKEREFFLTRDGSQPVAPPVPGHADEIIHFPAHKITFIFDSKFGRYPVPRAEMNWQLRLYFLMALDDIGGEKFFVAIRQPYLESPDDFHSAAYDASDAPAFRTEILNIIADCQREDAPRSVDAGVCTFCKAQGTPVCPESIKAVGDAVRLQVVGMSPKDLEKAGDSMHYAVVAVEKWNSRIKWCIERYPELFTRYKLAPPQETHRVIDNIAVFDVLYRKGLFGANYLNGIRQYLAVCCQVSLPELAMLIAEKQKQDVDDAKAFLFEELGQVAEENPDTGGLIESKPKARSIKRVSR